MLIGFGFGECMIFLIKLIGVSIIEIIGVIVLFNNIFFYIDYGEIIGF